MGHKGSKRAAKRVVTHVCNSRAWKVLLSICTQHQNTNRKTTFNNNFPLKWGLRRTRIRLITQKRTTDKNLHLLPPRGSHPHPKTKKNKIPAKDSLKLHFLFLFLVRLCFRFLTMVAGCAEQQTPGGEKNRQTSEEESVPATRVSAAATLLSLQYVPPHPAALLMKMLRIGQQPPLLRGEAANQIQLW